MKTRQRRKHLPGQHNQQAHGNGVSSINALAGISVYDADEYASLYGQEWDGGGVDLDASGNEELLLMARSFANGEDMHVVLDLEDGKRQVLEEMTPASMRQLADDLDEVLAVDETEFNPADPYDVIADTDSDRHGFYIAKDGVGGMRIQPADADVGQYLEMSPEQARRFAEMLRDIADAHEDHQDDLAADDDDVVKAWMKHPGHPDQSVHGRRRKPPVIDIPSLPDTAPQPKPPSATAGEPSTPPRNLSNAEADELQDQMLADNPPPWTRTQRKALREYTSNAFRRMNGALRSGLKLDPRDDKELLGLIRNANEAMRPTLEPMKVYRNADFKALGIKTFNRSMVHQQLRGLRGKTLQDPAFVSTSIERDVTGDDMPVKLEIEVPAGTPAAYVRRVSEFKHEREWVLGPGLKQEIVSISGDPRTDPHVTVRMRVVPA